MIPLSNGQTRYRRGLQQDPSSSPAEKTPRARCGERYLHFVTSRPGLRELVADAAIVREEWGEDFMALSHLPYKSDAYAGKGWALVADAAGFLDPYYSPGLDHAAMTIFATLKFVEKDLQGLADEKMIEQLVKTHSDNFVRAYQRWLEALYLGKYELMGDADLLGAAMLIDTALYYLGVVTPVTRNVEAVADPAFGLPVPQTAVAHWLMRSINGRLTQLARFRRQAGTYGKNNAPATPLLERVPARLPGLHSLPGQGWAFLVARRNRTVLLRFAPWPGRPLGPSTFDPQDGQNQVRKCLRAQNRGVGLTLHSLADR